MVVLFTEAVQNLRDRGIVYVGIDVGENNQHLHRRDLLARVAHGDKNESSELREYLIDIDQVHWQGEEWGFESGTFPESVARQGATHDIYIRGEGIELEPLFDSWQDTWMEELSNCPLDELKDNKRWQFRAREVREDSGYDLSPRMAEVYVLDEIGRSTAEIASVLDISEGNVQNRRETIEERVGQRELG